jgi:hypothetical protein
MVPWSLLTTGFGRTTSHAYIELISHTFQSYYELSKMTCVKDDLEIISVASRINVDNIAMSTVFSS